MLSAPGGASVAPPGPPARAPALPAIDSLPGSGMHAASGFHFTGRLVAMATGSTTTAPRKRQAHSPAEAVEMRARAPPPSPPRAACRARAACDRPLPRLERVTSARSLLENDARYENEYLFRKCGIITYQYASRNDILQIYSPRFFAGAARPRLLTQWHHFYIKLCTGCSRVRLQRAPRTPLGCSATLQRASARRAGRERSAAALTCAP